MLTWGPFACESVTVQIGGGDDRREELLRRLRAEYAEMPGLSLTCAQAGRLCGLAPADCEGAFEQLVSQGVLRRTDAGAYVRV